MFVVKENVKTLSHLKMQQRFFAQNGRPGSGRNKDGAGGTDAVVEVPPGTVVYDAESGEQLLDLTETGTRTVLFAGGRGGKGNTHFKSSRLQTPRFAQPGEEGVEKRLRVELRIIADLGFVGLPNAGKSTLLKVLTAADPKIGNYPFTTVIPNLGVMHRRERDVVLADIPGIIAGASDGAGLGLRFLRHITRTKALVFLVDVSDDDPEETYRTLTTELERYSPALVRKPRIVVASKTDLIDAGEVDADQVAAIRGVAEDDGRGELVDVVPVSAMTSRGLEALRDALVDAAELGEGDER